MTHRYPWIPRTRIVLISTVAFPSATFRTVNKVFSNYFTDGFSNKNVVCTFESVCCEEKGEFDLTVWFFLGYFVQSRSVASTWKGRKSFLFIQFVLIPNWAYKCDKEMASSNWLKRTNKERYKSVATTQIPSVSNYWNSKGCQSKRTNVCGLGCDIQRLRE